MLQIASFEGLRFSGLWFNVEFMLRVLFALFFMSFCLSTFVLSADYYSLGASGAVIVISEHSVCRGVSNSSGNVYFVPTRSASEWANFRSNPPPGVTVLSCCAKVC